MTCGESMRKARVEAGLSIVELSNLSGVSQSNICLLEHDHHSGVLSTIEMLADALGLSIDEYVGHEVVKRNGQAKD